MIFSEPGVTGVQVVRKGSSVVDSGDVGPAGRSGDLNGCGIASPLTASGSRPTTS
jgi:hypothetical protein